MTENIAKGVNGIERHGFNEIQSSDTEGLLELQEKVLTEIDLEEMLNWLKRWSQTSKI